MDKKTESVKIDDDNSLSGWEFSFVDDYFPEAGEEKKPRKGKKRRKKMKTKREGEGSEMNLLGVYVVDQQVCSHLMY